MLTRRTSLISFIKDDLLESYFDNHDIMVKDDDESEKGTTLNRITDSSLDSEGQGFINY
jgi:hypothetical protein